MKNCLNNDFEGKIIEIPGNENNPDEYFFKYKSYCKGYIIGINLNYNNTGIIISIDSKYKNNNIPIRKLFTYEEIEKYDPEFFKPFKGNIIILFKFISRLLLVNLVDLEIKIKGNKNLYFLILNCLKDCELRPIAINLNNDDAEKIIIDRTSVFKNNNKKIKLKTNNKIKDNKNYKIELRKIEHEYENSEIYKEIEIKFIKINNNNGVNEVYFDYLDSQDIFNRDIPYYELFNGSIDDVFDDLYIIIFHKNFFFEKCKESIKFSFFVFNNSKKSNDPYISNFIEALNRERENNELQYKMKEYFDYKLKMKQNSEKTENINDQNKEKAKKENKKNKKEIENNSKMSSYLLNFLSMKKNIKSNNDENKNNNELKNENKDQNIQKQNNNKYINIEKNELIEPKFLNESKINNNINNILSNNLLEKKHETSKDDSSYTNQKRYRESTLEMYFGKSKKIEENVSSEKKEIILNNDENNNNSNNKDIIKKLNIYKPIKGENKKSEDMNMRFKLNENGCYNIDKDEVINFYLNVLYEHPLDNDEEYEIIENKEGKKYCLCKICKKFFNSKISVREHQWNEHLKPFGRKIQNDLKSKNKNK